MTFMCSKLWTSLDSQSHVQGTSDSLWLQPVAMAASLCLIQTLPASREDETETHRTPPSQSEATLNRRGNALWEFREAACCFHTGHHGDRHKQGCVVTGREAVCFLWNWIPSL